MCPPGIYRSANGLMVTHALGHIMYGYILFRMLFDTWCYAYHETIIRKGITCKKIPL